MASVVWTVAAYPVGIASLSLYLHKYAHPFRCCRIYILRPTMTHCSCVRFRPFLISIFVPINMNISMYMQRAYLHRYKPEQCIYIDVFYIHMYIRLRPASCEHNLLGRGCTEKDPAPLPICGRRYACALGTPGFTY